VQDAHCFVAMAFNDSPYLADCVRSLTAQTVHSRTIVATSTPSSFIAAAARDAGAELIVNPDRRGMAADWNFALCAARTRFVTLAHQDDVYYPAFVARTMALFRRYPHGSLCFTGHDQIDDTGKPYRSKLTVAKDLITVGTIGSRTTLHGRRLRLYLSFGCPVPCSSVTFDRSRLRSFRFNDEFSCNLDWDAWWRLQSEGHRFLQCREPLVGRRFNALTATARLKRTGLRREEDLKMFTRIWPRGLAQAIALLYTTGY
jgi:GT2 family glycosyltransferase